MSKRRGIFRDGSQGLGPGGYNAVAAGFRRPLPIDPTSNPPTHENRETYSPLTDLFPELLTLSASFTSVPVPAGTVIGAGQAGWFGLGEWIAGTNPGQDFQVFGVSIENISCNHTPGTVPGNAWGNARGLGAQLWIGTNLPSVVGQWRSGPGLSGGIVSTLETSGVGSLGLIYRQSFPPGNASDTVPMKFVTHKHFSPFVDRIPLATQLQAALVLDGANVNLIGVAGGTVQGWADIQINVGLVNNPNTFRGNR